MRAVFSHLIPPVILQAKGILLFTFSSIYFVYIPIRPIFQIRINREEETKMTHLLTTHGKPLLVLMSTLRTFPLYVYKY